MLLLILLLPLRVGAFGHDSHRNLGHSQWYVGPQFGVIIGIVAVLGRGPMIGG